MEALIISFVALFAILIIGGAVLYGGNWKKRDQTTVLEPPPDLSDDQVEEIETALEQVEPERPKFRDRLGKARGLFGEYVGVIRGRSAIDQATWDDLEEAMIRADVGVATTTTLLDDMKLRVKAESIKTPDELIELLKSDLKKRLSEGNRDLLLEPGDGPNVWLFVGVNGVGKTTTIGKVGLRYANDGKKS